MSRRGGFRPGAGRKPHPWRTLTEAAIAYAEAGTDEEYRKASMRLLSAAKRYRDEPKHIGRPASGASSHGEGRG
jgi:hypothetical protein